MLKNNPSKISLTQFDLPEDVQITQDGFITIYESELQFQIQLQDTQYPNQETLNVRVLVMGGDQTLEQMKIELTSDSDLFFHFTHQYPIILTSVNEESFQHIKESQQITVQFIDYPAICVKSFDKAHKDPVQQSCILSRYSAVLNLNQNGEARVDIIQRTEYKEVELIQFQFEGVEEELIRTVISTKYQQLKQKLGGLEGKLKEINDVVKAKNPQLLLQMQKMRK